MIKAIFFDAAGILYTRSVPTEKFALDLLQKKGFPTEISPDQHFQLLTLKTQASRGLIDHKTYWDHFLIMRGVLDSQLRKDFSSAFINFSNEVQPIPGVRESLMGLKQKGFLLGIITDTMYPVEWKMRRLEKVGVSELIDIVACSTDLGAHKPDPAVYLYALKQANLHKNESAFVGHLSIELNGAQRAGMITIAINHDPEAIADYYCNSISDLLDLPILQRVHEEATISRQVK